MDINFDNIQALDTMVSAAFQKGLTTADTSYEAIATVLTSSGKYNTYTWLGQITSLREWVGDRVIDEIAGHSYTLVNKKWEKTLAIPADDIKDDQYGNYAFVAEDIGKDAVASKGRLVWKALQDGELATSLGYDGVPFFSANHPVGDGVQSNIMPGAGPAWYVMDLSKTLKPLIFQLREDVTVTALINPTDANVFFSDKYIWGANARFNAGYGMWQTAVKSKDVLTDETLGEARARMRSFTDDAGVPLAVVPTTLVVGASNEMAALKLVNAMNLATGETNINKGLYKLIVSPYLP